MRRICRRRRRCETPGRDEKSWQEEEEDRERLNNQDASQYRALMARANYLALDRFDIQYAVKEMCGRMSNPSQGDLHRLRRLGRYFVGRLRSVWRCKIQAARGELVGYTDSDWAGCRKTGRSTSGGVNPEGTTHPQYIVSHPEERDPELRRSRASGNGEDEL